MELKLHRRFKGESYTIGSLFLDSQYFCDTLEDTDRGLDSKMSIFTLAKLKVQGKTAIPYGKYKIDMYTISPKFSKVRQYDFCKGALPRLAGVPGFNGVLIHIGNGPEDTEGCILVGQNKVKGKVINSTATFTRLYSRMEAAADNGETLTIEIV